MALTNKSVRVQLKLSFKPFSINNVFDWDCELLLTYTDVPMQISSVDRGKVSVNPEIVKFWRNLRWVPYFLLKIFLHQELGWYTDRH